MVRLTRYNVSTRIVKLLDEEEGFAETYFTERPDGEVVMARDVASLDANYAEVIALLLKLHMYYPKSSIEGAIVGPVCVTDELFRIWDRLRELTKDAK